MTKSKLLSLSILLFSTCLFNVSATEKLSEAKTSIKAKAEQVQQTMVDLNSADVTQLATLKGIGEKRAQAIIDYREQHGKFTSLQQLLEVKGIGSAFLQENKNVVKI